MEKTTETELDALRKEIDKTDEQILSLFYKRMGLCIDVANYKKENHLNIFQSGREDEILNNIRNKAPEKYCQSAIALYTTIMEVSKILQQKEISPNIPFIEYKDLVIPDDCSVGVPGTKGSNSYFAARKIFNEKNIKFYSEFEDICKDVDSGKINYGILPIDNSTAGTVNQTYELAEKYNFHICLSTKISVSHCLAIKKGSKLSNVNKVYSHPQALMQCSNFIKENNLESVSYSNTALAAEMVSKSDSNNISAICSEYCAELFGLEVVAKNINDISKNVTKFIIITKHCYIPDKADTISIILTIPNKCGSLYRLLAKFFVNDLNMEEIESRPMKDGSFNYRFHIDFNGNINDREVKSLLHDLKLKADSFKFLGNYKSI